MSLDIALAVYHDEITVWEPKLYDRNGDVFIEVV